MIDAKLTYDSNGYGTLEIGGVDVTEHVRKQGVSLRGDQPPILTVEFNCSSVELNGIVDLEAAFPPTGEATSLLIGEHEPAKTFGCGICGATWFYSGYKHRCPTDSPE